MSFITLEVFAKSSQHRPPNHKIALLMDSLVQASRVFISQTGSSRPVFTTDVKDDVEDGGQNGVVGVQENVEVSLNQKVAKLTVQLDSLKLSLRKVKKQNSCLERTAGESQADCEYICDQRDEALEEVTKLKLTVRRLKMSLDDKRAELQGLLMDNQDLKKLVDDQATDLISSLFDGKDDIEDRGEGGAVSGYEDMEELWKARVDELIAERDSLKLSLKVVRYRNSGLETEARDMEAEYDLYCEKSGESEEEIRRLKAANLRLKSIVEETRDKIHILSLENHALKKTIDNLEMGFILSHVRPA
ncbi:hypothetical protein JAAARDRAFT_201111 [Jaapia argillacea MUCL 33604]|uniref:Autophagy-related protein 16 domain-containing protein n=1 Tax=Jaapia argillacea MUCL 33604 TaxID=933084 RepID=A0A067PDN5_9AGAM|nr:hypothetical protein JAAARDRAFT_201111 [Jaapia argillacea MUCL 33604]